MSVRFFQLSIAIGCLGTVAITLPLFFEPQLAGRWCDANMIWRECYREWLGSLSGWAAFAGALLGSGLLLAHLKQLHRQSDLLIAQLQRHDLNLVSSEGRGGVIMRSVAARIQRRAATMSEQLDHGESIEEQRFGLDLARDDLTWARQVAPMELLGAFVMLEHRCSSIDYQLDTIKFTEELIKQKLKPALEEIAEEAGQILDLDYTPFNKKVRPHFHVPTDA